MKSQINLGQGWTVMGETGFRLVAQNYLDAPPPSAADTWEGTVGFGTPPRTVTGSVLVPYVVATKIRTARSRDGETLPARISILAVGNGAASR